MSTISRGCPECGAVPGEPHVAPCSFHERYEAAARGALCHWLASLPAEYERLKRMEAARVIPQAAEESWG
jgi:hypothetical protein